MVRMGTCWPGTFCSELNLPEGEASLGCQEAMEVRDSGRGDMTWQGLELMRGRLSLNLLEDCLDLSLATARGSSSLKSDMLWRSVLVSSSLG